MPDGPREKFEPVIRVAAPRVEAAGFTRENTSGLDAAELAALNRALSRLLAAGLSEWDAKRAIDAAVRAWLRPADAADAELERLLAWR